MGEWEKRRMGEWGEKESKYIDNPILTLR
jgi:hypothetical protein